MDILEKRTILKDMCSEHESCGCPLEGKVNCDVINGHSFLDESEVSDEDIEEFYNIVDSDNVNHPQHYTSGKHECIDVMLETQGTEVVKGFCIGNAFKYLYRHMNKNGLEDIKKCLWYLNKYVELTERGNDGTEDIH